MARTSVLPSEPNPSKPYKPAPRGRKPPSSKGGSTSGSEPISNGKPRMPLPTEPNPAGRYKALKNSFAKPGMQPGEKEAIAAIMKNRGVTAKEARVIGKRRTSKGLTTAGVSGPKGNPKMQEKGRQGVPLDKYKPMPMNRPGGPVNGPAPKPPKGAGSVVGSAPEGSLKSPGRPSPKRPPVRMK